MVGFQNKYLSNLENKINLVSNEWDSVLHYGKQLAFNPFSIYK